MDVKKMWTITTKERMLRAYVRETEAALRYRYPLCTKAYHKLIEQSVVILDLFGGSSKLFTAEVREVVQKASGISQDYFPEAMAK